MLIIALLIYNLIPKVHPFKVYNSLVLYLLNCAVITTVQTELTSS